MSEEELWERFTRAHVNSERLFRSARTLMPGGMSHNNRKARPFPLFVDRAEGAYKWDVDGNQYLDYNMGSASLLLGHSHAGVIEAIANQLTRGTGATACHELELRWAELVRGLIPSAERVRFTGSGTEATMLAFRLARAYTGRQKILRVQGHYHGWHDYLMVGHRAPYSRPASAGVPPIVLDTMLVASIDDPFPQLEELLSTGEVAAVIFEPTGASWGTAPLPNTFASQVRESTKRHGTLLIMDEVITGFRIAPGGFQGKTGITPDLTTLGKILTGGLPGGAVVGKANILDLLSPWEQEPKYVFHYGTFNANPLSMAAGIATLEEVQTGIPHKLADAHAEQLRDGLSEILQSLSVDGFAYGESSIFHVFLRTPNQPRIETQSQVSPSQFLAIPSALIEALQCELRMQGLDLLSYNGGVTSSSHSSQDLDRALMAFQYSLQALRDGKVIGAV